MIRIRLVLSDDRLVSVDSEGHATASSAQASAPCAAVSVALKALGSTVVGRDDLAFDGEIPGPGVFRLRIDMCPAEAVTWLRGVTAITRRSLEEIRDAFPQEVELEITEE